MKVICEKAKTCAVKIDREHCKEHEAYLLNRGMHDEHMCTKPCICALSLEKVKCIPVEEIEIDCSGKNNEVSK